MICIEKDFCLKLGRSLSSDDEKMIENAEFTSRHGRRLSNGVADENM